MPNSILWEPPAENFQTSQLAQFILFINNAYRLDIADYFALHQWSVSHLDEFWESVWKFCDLKLSKHPKKIFIQAEKPQDNRWFEGAELNFAENLLRRRDNHPAIIYISEGGDKQQLTFQELFQKVAALALHLKTLGIKKNDCIAGYLPNSPATVIAMLATASLGAIWTSCSSDFGLSALLDRFEQVKPKVLFAADGHFYNGKNFSHLPVLQQLQDKLPSLVQTIIVPFLNSKPDITTLKHAKVFDEILDKHSQISHIDFEATPFSHPLYILYSSGTTGKPKCLVHSAGGTLIQHLKELKLHTNLQANDKIFFYTTCGWMMWNWLVSSLAVGATIVLYEGNPFFPTPDRLFDLIDELQINFFGAGAKLIESAESKKLEPIKTHHLSSLKTILTTASPLLPESFDYIYRSIKSNVQVSSISGGSDIISCFALGNPLLPVYRGELQCIGLGMDVKIFDEQGQAIFQKKGELTCVPTFPCMPIYFWNDSDGSKYQKAYFDKYPNIWAHGDYAMLTQHGGIIIYGRSDATLNPGGIRIGTAEIYNQVKKFSEILDSLAVGQNWQGSERIILFIVPQANITVDDELILRIKKIIRENVSPHHIPAKIISVPDLPRTISGKVMELTIKKIIHNEAISNLETLANPECLQYFKNIPELTKE